MRHLVSTIAFLNQAEAQSSKTSEADNITSVIVKFVTGRNVRYAGALWSQRLKGLVHGRSLSLVYKRPYSIM